MREHGRTIGLDVFIEPQARSGTPRYSCQRGLPCIERLTPQVVTVQLDQVEGLEEHAGVVPPIADSVEARHAIAVAGHSLTIDDAGA
jgi:hypothetical protein